MLSDIPRMPGAARGRIRPSGPVWQSNSGASAARIRGDRGAAEAEHQAHNTRLQHTKISIVRPVRGSRQAQYPATDHSPHPQDPAILRTRAQVSLYQDPVSGTCPQPSAPGSSARLGGAWVPISEPWYKIRVTDPRKLAIGLLHPFLQHHS